MRSVLIVGGGIVGVTAALELRRRGWRVALVDPGPIPHPEASSTDISKVIRMDYGADDLYTDLMEIAMPRWRSWNAKFGEELYHEAGFLILSSGAMAQGGFEYESYMRLRERGHPVERMDSAEIKARFPAWNFKKYVDGYLNPNAGWAASGRVVARLVEEARSQGVEIHEGKKLGLLIEVDSRVVGIETGERERHNADFTIIAAGAWTPTLIPSASDLMTCVGQPVVYLSLADPWGSPYPHQFDIGLYQPPRFPCWAADIAKTGWYGFPALEDGTLKIGNHGPGIKMHPDDRIEAPESHITHCREFLGETFPDLVEAPLKGTRICRYCDAWDGNFFIDHVPGREGLFIAAGGSGHAFKFGPVFGELIADRLEGRVNRFSERFAWRQRGKETKEDARHVGAVDD